MKSVFFAFILNVILFLVSCSSIGENMPKFELTEMNGSTITQEELTGKITVINVWGTWCGNCLNEIEELNELAAKYQNDDSVMFIAISDEPSEIIRAFLGKRPFNFKHISNGLALTDALQTQLVKTYPQHIVLDGDLTIRFEHSGEIANTVNVLSNQIEALR